MDFHFLITEVRGHGDGCYGAFDLWVSYVTFSFKVHFSSGGTETYLMKSGGNIVHKV